MRSETVNPVEALKKDYWIRNGYRYLWKQELSCVFLGRIEDAGDLEEENLLEARIFADGKELHLFYFEDQLRAVVTTAGEEEDCLEERQILRERFGKSLTIRHYIGYEEDGQAYIMRSVLNDYQ